MNGARFELKIAFPAPLMARVKSWLRLHPAAFRVAYPCRQINSLYFDTPDLTDLRANINGLPTRRKLRLRWYGQTPLVAENPALELKLKDNLLGRKPRHQLALSLNLQQPWSRILPDLIAAAPPVWAESLRYSSTPTLINHYQRCYWVAATADIRATLDTHITYYDQRQTPRPNLGRAEARPQLCVLEIKGPADQTARIEQIMAAFPLPRSRHSKYAIGLAGW